jgi:hypothetical protein
MPTILDLFNSEKKELYNKEFIRIETKGLVNLPRVAALAASSPNTLADLVGGQIAGAVGGTANRPSDTIFNKYNPLAKPITLTAATTAQLQDVVEAGKDYVVKQKPSPDSVLNDLVKGGSSASGVATNLAIQGLNKFGSKNGLKKLSDSLKDKTNDTVYTNIKPFSKYINGKPRIFSQSKTWDKSNEDLNTISFFKDDMELQKWINENRFSNQVPISFQKYGNKTIIPFVGAISGISEDIQPEWSNFKYVGSPFKTYRYGGVERSVKFNLKLYYMGIDAKQTMVKKINYLKSLAFPDNTISEITYGNNPQSNQYAFSPNLIYFTIGDLYKNMFGYMESLSISIDDNTVWSNFNPTNKSGGDNELYPSVIDASIGIKIIENHTTTKDGTITKYKYNFDGRGDEFIKEEKEPVKQSAFNSDGSIKNKNIQLAPVNITSPKIGR